MLHERRNDARMNPGMMSMPDVNLNGVRDFIDCSHFNFRETSDIIRLSIRSFDLVIMDLEMPVIGGIETAKAIRSTENCLMVPIIPLSGHTSRRAILDARQSGIGIRFGKPVRKYEPLDALITRNGKAGPEAFRPNQTPHIPLCQPKPNPCWTTRS